MKKKASLVISTKILVALVCSATIVVVPTACSRKTRTAKPAKTVAQADKQTPATDSAPIHSAGEELNPTQQTSPVADHAASSQQDSPESRGAAEEKDGQAKNDPSSEQANSTEVPAETSKDDAESVVAPAKAPERMLVFTAAGPLVIDFNLSVDGMSLAQASEKLIDSVLEMGDANSDRSTTWKELTTHRAFMYGQFGNPRVDSEQQRQEMVTNYDINRNERVDRNEVLGYLRQNAADSKYFALQQSNAGNQMPPQSGVLKWLDANQDNLLDQREISNAVDRLWLNDIQDDKLLLANDFQTPQPAMQNRRSRYRAKRQGVLITEYTNWSKLLFEMEEHYSYGDTLTRDDILGFESFFNTLDTDQDDEISTKEFSKLPEIAPHFVVHVVFRRAHSPTVSIDVVDTSVAYEQLHVDDQRASIILADSSLTFDLRDDFANDRNENQLAELFANADKNMDSYLSEEEYQQYPGRQVLSFEAVDVDEDDKVYLPELKETLEQTQQASANRVSSSIGQQNDVTFEYLDADRNGRLTTREVMAASDRLAAADTNEDGYVSMEELPSSLAISLRRGGNQNLGNVVPQQDAQAARQNGASTEWFANMDANRDGELSQSEFLGPVSIFKENDLNNDGFITSEEMSQAN